MGAARRETAIWRVGLRHRGRGYEIETGRRFFPLCERSLARSRPDSGGQTGLQFAAGYDRPHRTTAPRFDGRNGEEGRAETNDHRRQGRRLLQVLYGRGTDREGRRCRVESDAGGDPVGQRARGPGGVDGTAKLRFPRRHLRPVRGRRHQGPEEIRRVSGPGWARVAGPRLLSEAGLRGEEAEVPSLRRAAPPYARLAGSGQARRRGDRLRNKDRRRQLDQDPATRSHRDLQRHDGSGAGNARAKICLAKISRRSRISENRARGRGRKVGLCQDRGDL